MQILPPSVKLLSGIASRVKFNSRDSAQRTVDTSGLKLLPSARKWCRNYSSKYHDIRLFYEIVTSDRNVMYSDEKIM